MKSNVQGASYLLRCQGLKISKSATCKFSFNQACPQSSIESFSILEIDSDLRVFIPFRELAHISLPNTLGSHHKRDIENLIDACVSAIAYDDLCHWEIDSSNGWTIFSCLHF